LIATGILRSATGSGGQLSFVEGVALDTTGIATSSIEEGLDFGFNLLIGPAAETGQAKPDLGAQLLFVIQAFVRPRYAGEPEIALDSLEHLAELIPREYQRNWAQVRRQLTWLREQM
jgi:hypothetical protein